MEKRWRVSILFETLRRSGARTEGSSRPPPRPRPPTSSEEQQQERSPSSSSGSSNAKRQGLRSVSEQSGNGRAPSPNEASALPPRANRQPPHSLPGGSGSGHARSPSEAAAPAAPSPSKATAVAAPSPREAAAAADPKFGQHLPPRSGYLCPISAGLGRKSEHKLAPIHPIWGKGLNKPRTGPWSDSLK